MSTKSRISELIKGKHYEVVIEAGRNPLTGGRQRIVRRVKGRLRDAEDLRDELTYQLKHGTYLKPHKATLSEYLKEWFETHETNLAPSTAATYKAIINKHIKPAIGSIPLSDLCSLHIQQYYSEQLKDGLAPRTVQQHHSVLHKALKQAVKWHFIVLNPAEDVAPPKPEYKAIRTLSFEESILLYEELSKHHLGPLYILLAETGMRLGEVLALRWEDVHLPMVWIRQSLSRVEGVDYFKQPKSNKTRQVVLTAIALKVLNGRVVEEGLIFCDQDGRPLTPSVVSRTFKRLAKKAGFTMRLHDLRHTHATQLLELGINPRVVQERLGHHEVSFTLGRYTHVVNGMQELVIDSFDRKRDLLQNGRRMAEVGVIEEKQNPEKPIE